MGRVRDNILAAALQPGPPFNMRGAINGRGGWPQSERFADRPPAPRSTKALNSDFFARAAVVASPSACQAPRSLSNLIPIGRLALAGARRLGGRAGLPNRRFCMHGARVFCGRMLGYSDSLAGRVSHGARACQTFTAGHPCEASGRLPVFHSVFEVVGSLCPLLDLRACGAGPGDRWQCNGMSTCSCCTTSVIWFASRACYRQCGAATCLLGEPSPARTLMQRGGWGTCS